ncbi:MAG: DUF3427 domain-containing protein [Lachnospiraceae bacterium]|nr:DUF3427 domain-containing protein [Lachnospiraceae bacterium]
MLKPGLYEQVINKEIKAELSATSEDHKLSQKIDSAEASGVLTGYISEVIKKSLDKLSDGENVTAQVELINKIVNVLSGETGDDIEKLSVTEDAEQLIALLSSDDPMVKIGKKKAKDVVRPETSVSQSSLFTGAIHEPQMFSELKKEIATADRIDMLVSFIRWSGLRLIIDELREFTERGGALRIITTSYMGATEVRAVNELCKLPNTELRISYDTKRTRLHAKAYVFYRNTGYTTAYIGSSNLSNAAMSSGLEWNVKATAKDMLATIQKVDATFESYWNTPGFERYDESKREKLEQALKAEKYSDNGSEEKRQFIFDINPYPYQQEILDNLQAERVVRGKYKNLVVAATGTGKTLISAFDYRNFCKVNLGKKNRLLFVVHREEILKQSRDVFQAVLKDPNFGELFVGNYKPSDNIDYLFMSVQTMASQKDAFEKLPEDFYDYIIVDEFHHAAAPTYQFVLSHFKPKILLGLTATPERMDGKDVLEYFDGRIAAEIRLPEAIERKLLCPFQYFGVSDDVDLSQVKWTRGGYDKSELSNIFSLNNAIASRRANHIINSINKYVTDINKVHGLGFCVSVEHANFMAEHFNSSGIASIALSADSNDEIRRTAKQKLVSGEIKFIFVVDLYNEGVDIPEIDTVLFLRPTESLTVFLQQLGRGLRLADGKDCLTVLDFIGQANKKYNFEEKFAALLANTNHSVQHEIKKGFVSLPKGCYIQLEKKASDVILDNIKKAFGDKNGLINKLKTFEEDSGLELSLSNFVRYYHIPLKTIYKNYSFSRLCAEAKVRPDFSEPLEETLTKSLGKIVAIDSRRWIEFLINNLSDISIDKIRMMNPKEQRMMQMFYISIWNKSADWDAAETIANIKALSLSTVMLGEIIEILKYNLEHIDFIDHSVDLGFECPLDVHCTYTRDQLLVAMDYMTPNNVREGVKWLPDQKLDVFMVTLNKSDKDYSPTTMYDDYSINEELFHWQSQNATSDTSSTGQRYINHVKMGTKVLLFVREFKKDDYGTAPYTFLGTATYLMHTGNKPMSITWRLDDKIPAKYLKKTNKLVVG